MLQPFFTYFGGKWRAAPHYPAPQHKTIIEPFAGSAGYALLHPKKDVILVEKNKRIADIWHYLITSNEQQIQKLPININGSVDNLDIEPAARDLIGLWLNKGAAAPSKTPSKWMRSGTHNNSYWGSVVRDRIAQQVNQIKHWQIYNDNYAVIVNQTATWFIDPPYQKAGVHYKESATALDFNLLAKWCKERQGQVIVCENFGANWLPFTPFRTIKGTEGKDRTGVSQEVIWTNEKIGFF